MYFVARYIEKDHVKISGQSDKNCKNSVACTFVKVCFEKNVFKLLVTDILHITLGYVDLPLMFAL